MHDPVTADPGRIAPGETAHFQKPPLALGVEELAACGCTTTNMRDAIQPIHWNMSPFGSHWYAKDFYDAYKIKGGPRFSPSRLTLLAQAVELAAKGLHVKQGKRDADLRKIGHDLVKACDPSVLSISGITLTADEETELGKMRDLNIAKAFEYFWFPWKGDTPELAGVMHAVTGRKGLPDEVVVEGLLIRLLAPKI